MRNISLPINNSEKGYVLSITLLIMSLSLLIIASLLKCQTFTSAYHAIWKETSSIKLMTENKAMQEQMEVSSMFEQLQGALYNQYHNLCSEDVAVNKEAFQILSAAQAYLLTTQTFFFRDTTGSWLNSNDLVEERIEVHIPYMQTETFMKIKCKKYTGNVHFATNPSKDQLVRYDEVKKYIKKIEVTLQKGDSIQSQAKVIETLKTELIGRPLYEIGVTTQVVHETKGVLSKQQVYIRLKLVENNLEVENLQEELAYVLQLEDYQMMSVVS